MGLSDSRLSFPFGYVFPKRAYSGAGLPGSSINLSTHAVPFHPGEPVGCIYSFLHQQHWASPSQEVWPLSLLRNEAVSGSLSLWLMSLSHEASPIGITPNCARLTTCATSNSHGELLSVHEIDQAILAHLRSLRRELLNDPIKTSAPSACSAVNSVHRLRTSSALINALLRAIGGCSSREAPFRVLAIRGSLLFLVIFSKEVFS
jgi:hypothetical protein